MVNKLLLLCDYQNDILVSLSPVERERIVGNTQRLLHGARTAGIPVIFVGVCFRSGYPEVNMNNKMYQSIKNANVLLDGTIGAQFEEALQPQPNEPVVVKKRVGAHFNTELPLLLKAHGTEEVIISGVSTSGVVLSTVRYLADSDFLITVVQDCCADRDQEVHNMLCQRVFTRQANVVNVDSVLPHLIQ
eukprot:CAMPEP_0196574206 /NCGR_PEP_ID=MMETSP1081-20130531/3966_1 /TAXON_ID=36882 /ORGANISM="Pyramimonas amylifera, Strain CCMP720" /LENGTH=188 /DNA_ID=CAMNT_0041892153 /DNA_START=112 /DNA_END=678 /DNA_ORIENTATION=+